jgi:type II secretory pathway pseudopilin PulG
MTKNQETKNNSPKSGSKLEFILSLFIAAIIVTIISALSLPSFLCQANRSRDSEGKQYVGSMNRAQQSKYAENGSFVNSIDALGIGIKTETTNYRYSTEVTKNTAFNYGVAKDQHLPSFVGGAFFIKFDKVTLETTPVTILCKENNVGIIKPNPPKLKNDQPVCGAGTEEVKKELKFLSLSFCNNWSDFS